MKIEHWMTCGLLGAGGAFQRAAREYAEEYAAAVVSALAAPVAAPEPMSLKSGSGTSPAPALTTCNCRWDGADQVSCCALHQAHIDAIHEWAERAKSAEVNLKEARAYEAEAASVAAVPEATSTDKVVTKAHGWESPAHWPNASFGAGAFYPQVSGFAQPAPATPKAPPCGWPEMHRLFTDSAATLIQHVQASSINLHDYNRMIVATQKVVEYGKQALTALAAAPQLPTQTQEQT